MRIFLLLLVGLLFPTTGSAQIVTNITDDSTYLAVSSFVNPGGVCAPPRCVNPQNGIPLNFFATTETVSANGARIDAAFAAVATLNTQVANLNREVSRSLEIGAIAASMRDAIPNAGDRFAIRLNAAAIDGYAGGSLGVSMNVTDSVRLSANYGRGATQNVVSGGLNISFR